ncbi:unnamed protein product [Acanthoscelides obtectus]|uniref:Uncharacterized protein n=1 Tax=Acanthoscelides obtectus TaxID=200917 RepID=A0A9P0K850_ACAOB|nr:unnamed protein product [Acanthoscelides obtectus]CAK1671968.1 hypothetical protein AOBTE_LOCUS28576 [Acanthoscelides obtectus]
MLFALGTAQRLQTFSKIKIDNIYQRTDFIDILIPDILKTSGPGRIQPRLRFSFFRETPELCLSSTLIEFLSRSQNIIIYGKNSRTGWNKYWNILWVLGIQLFLQPTDLIAVFS